MEYKGYNIISDPVFMMKVITRVGAGKVPAKLLGTFTTESYARKAIDSYVIQKESKDGKQVSTSRD